jgi:hypothetical protein
MLLRMTQVLRSLVDRSACAFMCHHGCFLLLEMIEAGSWIARLTRIPRVPCPAPNQVWQTQLLLIQRQNRTASVTAPISNPMSWSRPPGRAKTRNYTATKEGAQTGTNRAPQTFPDTASNLNTKQAVAAFKGSVTTRTPHGSGQGISSRSADEENEGEQRVVRNRPDAQAGVNHSR